MLSASVKGVIVFYCSSPWNMCKYTHFFQYGEPCYRSQREMLKTNDSSCSIVILMIIVVMIFINANGHSTGALGHPWQVFILDLLRPEDAADFPRGIRCRRHRSFFMPWAVTRRAVPAVQRHWFHSAVALWSVVFYRSINHCWHSQVIVIQFKEKMNRIVFWFLFGSRKWQKSHINKPILFSLCLTTQT